MKKRTLAMLLALVMLFSLLPVSVLAEEEAAEPAELSAELPPESVGEPETVSEPLEGPEDIPEPIEDPEDVPETIGESEDVPEPVEKPEDVPEPVEEPEDIPEPVEEPEDIPEPIEEPEDNPEFDEGSTPVEEVSGVEPLSTEGSGSVVGSGECGKYATWELTDDGTLTISGRGKMDNWSGTGRPAWFGILTDEAGDDAIKTVVIGDKITYIGNYSFRYCYNLTSVTLPDSLTEIGGHVFTDCRNLTKIEIPENVTLIGEAAFSGCKSLPKITVPDGVTLFRNYVFRDCESLKRIDIPEGVTLLGYGCFQNCSGITTITIPKSVTTIESSAFYGCGLTEITIPKTVTSIGNSAFAWCENLVSVSLPENLTSIIGSLFYQCSMLPDITIPESVTSIEKYAFDGCRSLTSITIPGNVSTIADAAFASCDNLTTFNFAHTADQPLTLGENVFSLGFGYNTPTQINVLDPNDIKSEFEQYNWVKDHRTVTYGQYIPPEGQEELSVGDVGPCTLTYKGNNKWSFDHDLTYYVSNASPTQYSQPLACMLSVLASAAYSQNHIEKSIKAMEFHNLYKNNYRDDDNYSAPQYQDTVGYSFSWKEADDGTAIVLVMLRGTYGNILDWGPDWQSDARIRVDWGPHPGFQRAEAQVYADLQAYLAKPQFDDAVKIVITGHSRAAGVGNLLAKHLLDTGMANLGNLYVYNFACPDSAVNGPEGWNPGGRYDCIFNISNVCDLIGAVPGELMSIVNIAIELKIFNPKNIDFDPFQLTWGKYGRTYLYSTNWSDVNAVMIGNPFKHHDDRTYVSHMGSGVGSFGNFKSWAESRAILASLIAANPIAAGASVDYELFEMIGHLIGVCCPVDVMVTDADGTPIAAVIGGEPVYYDTGSSSGPGMLSTFIWVEGDAKYIYVHGHRELNVRLLGTDEGEMYYSVLEIDPSQSDRVLADFEHVALEDGKTFVNEIPGDPEAEAVRLFVVNEEDTPIAEVEPGGAEIPLLSPVPELRLDHDYLILTPGETAQLAVLDLAEELASYVTWHWEAAEENIDTAILSVTEDGKVTALTGGTAYVIASLKANDSTYTARCRIDVVAGEDGEEHPIAEDVATEKNGVSGVRLVSPKVTTELFRTDYARIQVIPELTQNNITAQAVLLPTPAPAEDAGAAVEGARFTVPAVADLFSLRVVDDRTLELIPTGAALENHKLLKTSYASPIAVTVDGTEFTTGVLTVTVKKTEPKITAKAVALNSYRTDMQRVVFSGGTVLSADPDPAKPLPDWLFWDGETQSLYYVGAQNAKKSAKVTLLVEPEGWAVQRPVTVSVSAKSTAPKLSFKPASLTLKPGTSDSASTVWTLSPALFAGEEVSFSRITDGKNKPVDGGALNVTLLDGAVTVSAPCTDGLAHTYKVWLSAAGKEFAFTVKTLANKQAPSLTLKAAGSIDLAVAESPVKITATTKNFHTEQAVFRLVSICKAKTDTDVSESFNPVWNGSVLTITAVGEPETGTYTATVEAELGGTRLEKSVNFTVKRSVNPKASLSVKASGSIDVLRPGTKVTLTPTVKNLYTYVLTPEDITVTRTYDGARKAKVSEDATELFSVAVENGKYVVQARPEAGVSHADKFSVQATVSGVSSKAAALNVKQGAAKLGISTKSVTLLKTDRYSRGELLLTVTDPALAGIARVDLDGKNTALFDLKDLGNGRYAITYAGDVITTTKAQTVKLKVYLKGNMTAAPNATLSVKVNFA